MKRLSAIVLPCLAACSNGEGVTSHNWTCPDLVDQVVKMSQNEDAKILELTNVSEWTNSPGFRLECRGDAEWSQGYGVVKFGAHVSDGGNIIVEYSR